MELPRSRAALPEVIWLDSTPSTNLSMRELLAERPNLPHGAAVATSDQTAGRGRQGRDWQTPRGTALAVSFLIRGVSFAGSASALGVGWLPLLAGSAVAAAVRAELPAARVAVKWPNDVHVFDADSSAGPRGIGRKISGILCELLPGSVPGTGDVIVGAGINLLIARDALPTPSATSLLAEGSPGAHAGETTEDAAGALLLDRVFAAAGAELLRLVALAQREPALARERVEADSATLGTAVRVHLPGGTTVEGVARALAGDGSLEVSRDGIGGAAGETLTVSAGDVEHLR